LPRYVVMVKAPADDHPAEVRIYGPWRDVEKARRFRDSVVRRIERAEENDGEVGSSYAWVYQLRTARVRDAGRYALEGF